MTYGGSGSVYGTGGGVYGTILEVTPSIPEIQANNTGIQLRIFSYADILAPQPKWIVPFRKDPNYLEEMGGNGGGGFWISKRDPKYIADPTMLDSRNRCQIVVNGNVIGGFLLGERETTIVGTGEKAEEGWLITGPGLKTWFDDADVQPYGGLKNESFDNRHFNFSSEQGIWYILADWINPYNLSVVHSSSNSWAEYPEDWPEAAPAAQWIWTSPYNLSMPLGMNYFRLEVNVITAGAYAIYSAADDVYELFIDGAAIAKSSVSSTAYQKASRIEVNLSAGPHVIGYKAYNWAQPDGVTSRGPAGLIMSMFKLNMDTTETLFAQSGSGSWKCLPTPAAAPGWSIGEIILKLLDEADDRGILFPDYLTPTFTAEVDSNGLPWDKLEWSFGVGESYASVISKVEELYDVWIDPGTLELNIAAQRGTTWDVGSDRPIEFMIGKHLVQASTTAKGKIKNSIQIHTADGWFEKQDAASVAKYGRIETGMTTESGKDFADALASIVIAQRATEEEGASYELIPSNNIPWVHFWPGDWVLAPNERGLPVIRRVMSISIEETESGAPKYTIEFDTIFRNNEEKIARIVNKLGGGGVGGTLNNAGGINGGGNGGIELPPSPSAPILVPEVPTNLNASSVGSWNATGVTALSELTLTWDPVLFNTNGTETVPLRYEVHGQPSSAPANSWIDIGSTSDTTLVTRPYTPNEQWIFQVRAVNTNGQVSPWSASESHTMVGPTTPMVAPNTPAVTSDMGLMVVTWNGQLGSNPPPPQFRYVYAKVATSSGGTYTRMGPTLARDGRQITIPGLTLGTAYWAKLVAVDGAGIESPDSAAGSTTIIGVDLGNLDQNVTDAIEAAQEAADDAAVIADEAYIAAGLAQDDATEALSTANGMITWSPNVPVTGDGTGKPVDAVWYRTNGTGIIGQWRWTGSVWTSSPIDSDAILNLNAAKINAGFLDAARLQAGTISTSKLMVTSLENLAEDPSFEYSSTSGVAWTLGSGFTIGTTSPRTGTKSLNCPSGAVTVIATSVAAFAVNEGEKYRIEAWVRLVSGVTALNGVTVRFTYGTTESVTTTVTADLGVTPADTTTSYAPIIGVWTVPAGAKFARIQIIRRDTTAGKTYLVDDIGVYKMATGELIVDGAISADKIAAEAITAVHMSANSIAASSIQGQAITAEKIDVGAVTAQALAVDAVTANSIKAGEIQVSHLSPSVGNELNITANDSINLIVGPDGLIPNLSDDLNDTNDNLELMQTYYAFGTDGAVISKPGSVFATAIRNDRIEMLENLNVVSYWNNGTMYVDQFVGTKVTLGNHQIEQFENDTIVRWLP